MSQRPDHVGPTIAIGCHEFEVVALTHSSACGKEPGVTFHEADEY